MDSQCNPLQLHTNPSPSKNTYHQKYIIMEQITFRRKVAKHQLSKRTETVKGPVIVGAGPAGLAVGACLREQGVPFVIIDREDCVASLWQKRTYNRLKLNIPKQFCQLPGMPFPASFPEYPTRRQFISYVENYADRFQIHPQFNESVKSAIYDETLGLWRVKTAREQVEVEYLCRWLVVATGENAEKVVPEIDGLGGFAGEVIHTCDYRSGEEFQGKRVLVVGCGNSGMEVSLDLSDHNAVTSMVCRSMDHLPLEVTRKTPVLDTALSRIRPGQFQVVPAIENFSENRVHLVNGENLEIDAVILATGYRSNVADWLNKTDFLYNDRLPKTPFPKSWKGKRGLYAAGFTRRGLYGASEDAVKIANDITKVWNEETKPNKRTNP